MDHVVPKGLFLPPLPLDMVTVPACPFCNGDKSKDDDYFRDMLVIDIDNSHHPIVQELLKGRVARAARRNQSAVARDIRSKSKIVPFYTMGGVYLGQFRGIPLDPARINRIFARITRGLYYRLYRKPLPVDCVFKVLRVDRYRIAQAVQNMKDMGVTTRRTLGNAVFGCMHVLAIEDPSVSRWLQWYYNAFFTVDTNLGILGNNEKTATSERLD
jgi:hypothetical protein